MNAQQKLDEARAAMDDAAGKFKACHSRHNELKLYEAEIAYFDAMTQVEIDFQGGTSMEITNGYAGNPT